MSTVTEEKQRPIESTGHSTTGPFLENSVLAVAVMAGALITGYLVDWGVRHNPVKFMDLSVYRLGVKAWLDGADIYGQLPATSFGNHLPFIYPPFATVPFAPMAWLPWPVTWWLSTLMSLAALGLVIYLVARCAWPTGGWRGALLATAILLPASLQLQPITDTLWFGQVNLLLMALVVADLLVEKPKWPRGLLIGVAAAVKLTPAGFVLIFLLRKDFRSSATAVLGAAVMTVIGFAVNWSGSVRFWFGDTSLSTMADSIGANNQTIRAALGRLNLSGGLHEGLWLALSALVACLVLIGMRRVLRSGAPDSVPLAMVLTAALLLTVSPTAWGHHWVWVVPALVVIAGRAFRSPAWAVAFVAVAVAFWVRPFAPRPAAGRPIFWWRPFDSPPDLPDRNHHMHWTLGEHIHGNTYVLLTIVLLAVFVLRRAPGMVKPTSATELPESTAVATKHVTATNHVTTTNHPTTDSD